MRQRKIKLGKGEFEHIRSNGLTASVKDARDYFLDAVKEVAPEVLDDLAGNPYRLYKAAGLALDYKRYEKEFENLEFYDGIRAKAKIEHQHSWNHPRWENQFENSEVNYDENTRLLQKSIFSWSKKHNLDVVWCRARAYETIEWWYRSDSFYENRIWNYETEMQPIPVGLNTVFNFSYKSLYPVFRFRSKEKEIIREAFEKELNEFLDERDKIAKENGMIKPKQKSKYLHFIWLAKWQMDENLTHEKIAEQDERSNSIEVQAVSKAIKELAELIGLPLRKSKRGKKPTSM